MSMALKRHFIIENVKDAIVYTDVKGIVTYINPSFTQLTGYEKSEIIGENINKIIPETYSQGHQEHINQIPEVDIDKVLPSGKEVEILIKNNQKAYIYLTISRFIIDGQVTYVGILRDISIIVEQRKKLESYSQQLQQSLEESELKFHNFFMTARDGHFVANEKREIILINPSAERILETEFGALDQFTIDSFSDSENDKKIIRKELRERGYIENYDLYITMVDGRKKPIRLNITAELDQDGNVVGVYGRIRDLSRKRKMEKRLHEAERMKLLSKIASGLTHNYKNELTIMMGFSELVLETTDNEQHKKAMRDVIHAGKRSLILTNRLMSLGKSKYTQPEIINLNEIIKVIEPLLINSIHGQIKLSLNLGQELPQVKVDKIQIEEIMLNLVLNSRDAISGEGEITITTRIVSNSDYNIPKFDQFNDLVLLEVKDTGLGIKEEYKNQIFQKFFSTKLGGNGLGLASVKLNTELNNGHVFFESEYGKGTTFYLLFPIIYEIKDSSQNRGLLVDGNRIAIVDDDPIILRTLHEILKNKGIETTTYSSPNELLRQVQEKEVKFDIVISDFMMNEMDGFSLVEKLMSLDPDIKPIFMTGYYDMTKQIDQFDKYKSMILRKPFDIDTLMQKITSLN